MTRLSWDEYGILIARAASSRSEDPYFQVGACVLRIDHSIASVGYNGAAPGVELPWNDRDARRGFVIHAEVNALRYCKPPDTRGGYLYCTHHPCHECIKVIASYGIRDVIWSDPVDESIYDLQKVRDFATACGIEMRQVTV